MLFNTPYSLIWSFRLYWWEQRLSARLVLVKLKEQACFNDNSKSVPSSAPCLGKPPSRAVSLRRNAGSNPLMSYPAECQVLQIPKPKLKIPPHIFGQMGRRNVV